jgi:hypothetical protein
MPAAFRAAGESGQKSHGQRVRLLTRGTARAPHPQRAGSQSRLRGRFPSRDQNRLQEIELFLLAEETGLVGGDAVEHHRHLVLVRLDASEIVRVLDDLQRVQPFGQPCRQHGPLVVRQMNPGRSIDDVLEAPEVSIGERQTVHQASARLPRLDFFFGTSGPATGSAITSSTA